MGMAVLASCRGEETALYYGLRDYARNLLLNEDTHFRIASVSKLITALAALYLSEQGLLDLHKSLTEYFGTPVVHPDFPLDVITPFLLMNHRSGIQDGSTYSAFLMDSYQSENPPSILELLLPGGPYYAPNNWRTERPGTYFAYSNLNYGLLASVIEIAAQKRFDVFMKDDFLPLLGIPGSYNVADIDPIDGLAVLYRKPGGTWVPQVDDFQGNPPPTRELPGYVPGHNGLIFAPQGGLRTTAKGIMRAARFLLDGGMVSGQQIIGQEHLELILQPQWEWNGSNGDTYFDLYFAFGAGSHITTNRPGKDVVVPGHAFIGHPGAAYGLASDMYVNVEYDTSIIFITNGVGTGFRLDGRSSFYTIEKDVFEVYEGFIFDPCVSTVGTQPGDNLPRRFGLVSAYPNPFNPKIKISWEQPTGRSIDVSVYDVTGRRVANLANAWHGAGTHQLVFDGSRLGSGLYLVRLSDGNSQDTIKVTLVK